MSPTMHSSVHAPSHYVISATDAVDRHEYGVQKSRKPASTGGGRAWSEDEVRHDYGSRGEINTDDIFITGSLSSSNSLTKNAL